MLTCHVSNRSSCLRTGSASPWFVVLALLIPVNAAVAGPVVPAGFVVDTVAVALGPMTDILWAEGGLYLTNFGLDDVVDGQLLFKADQDPMFNVIASGGMIDPVRVVVRDTMLVVGDVATELAPDGKLWLIPFDGGPPQSMTSEPLIAPRPLFDVPAGFLVADTGGTNEAGDGVLSVLPQGGGRTPILSGIDPVDAKLDPADSTLIIVVDLRSFGNPSDGRLLRVPVSGGSSTVLLSGLGDPVEIVGAQPPVGTPDEFLVCDRALDRLILFDSATLDMSVFASGFSTPNGIAFADDGALYVVNSVGTVFRVRSSVTGVETPALIERTATIVLRQNVPNPVRESTSFEFEVTPDAPVELDIFDISGRHVTRVHEGRGKHLASWDGRDDDGRPVSPGVYLYRLRVSGLMEAKKLVLAPR